MNDREDFERRLTTALAAYAERTPIEVDAVALAAVIARRPVRRRWSFLGTPGTIGRSAGGLAFPLLLLVGLVLALIVGAIAAGAFRQDPITPLGRNGAIAYTVRDIAGPPYDHVHLISADGTEDREIAQGSCPTYSSDGHVLAYTSGWHEQAPITVASSDGSSPRTVPYVGPSDSALSPDGTEVAWFKPLGDGISRIFADGSSGGAGYIDELWVSPVAGGPGVRIVTHSDVAKSEWYQSPVWSPDGRRIAYAVMVTVFNADNVGAYRTTIDTVNVDGSDPREITSRPGTDGVAISWSPDGRAIAYVGLPDGSPLPSLGSGGGPPDSFYPAQDVFVVNADGTGDHDLTNTSAEEISPKWSPDGSRLAYQTFDGLDHRLAIFHMAGSTAVGSPAVGPVVTGEYTWSPDGTTLLWSEQTIVNGEATRTSIRTQDARFQRPASTVTTFPFGTVCVPSWQRLDP